MSAPVLPDYPAFVTVLGEILSETAQTRLQWRDEGLMRSAFARPAHLAAYAQTPGAFTAAAALAGGIARNHPLVDGNKRASAAAFLITLLISGWRLDVTQTDLAERFEALADGALDEAGLAQWGRAHALADPRFTRTPGT
ncbi:type II toxin-antitoxin system death-on-curing family toxin [Alkalicaulis satelles]|uniref:Type II toxin-antitoxin system death-on-curing family toxin n=1 Tax=Alkalicaulis satelles TaxID=2609175 RepID=A0A5M6Z975_9PROT|nr:Fic family protein [Alkalicaulis satelles]KAA5800895.1 type II toxin-antitoxin system death-on-curing family toxin [Alkalicaulis satelles]